MKLGGKVVTSYSGAGLTTSSSCKHFFRCTGGGAMTDSAGGVSWQPTTATLSYDEDLQAFHTDMLVNDTPEPITGVFNTFTGGSDIVGIVAARLVDGTNFRFALGDVNGLVDGNADMAGLGFANGPWHSAITKNGTYSSRVVGNGYEALLPSTDYSLTADFDGQDVLVLMVYESGTGIIRYDLRIIETYNRANRTAGELAGNPIINMCEYLRVTSNDVLPDHTPDPYMRFSGLKVYGAAYYEFPDGVPSDYDKAAQWMAAEWKRGNRYLYPGPNWL